MERHGEVCRSEQYVKCALPACLVLVLVGYTDPSRPFQVNEETTLCSRKSESTAAPVFRYFCSQAHCEEGKKDHEVKMKEYNSLIHYAHTIDSAHTHRLMHTKQTYYEIPEIRQKPPFVCMLVCF